MKKLTKQQVVEACINKELEPYGFTYDDVKKDGEFEMCHHQKIIKEKYFFGLLTRTKIEVVSEPWYQAFTFKTEVEYNNWKEFCINLFRKELKMTKKQAESEFINFDLSYGLKQEYLHNELPK